MAIVACVQLNGSSDIERNLAQTEALVAKAAAAGAKLVATPEATTYLGPWGKRPSVAEPLDGTTHARLAALAKKHGVTLLVGSVVEALDDERTYNTSLVFGPDGALLDSYRKMHLFDVDIAGGVQFRESASTGRGEALKVVDTPVGKLGLSICFDLRFPEMYRALTDRGAQILAVPAAFTLMTGKDHWHVLLRARAIECQCYVIAPGQWGEHDDGGLKQSYGHSVIIDPWGTVIAECADGEGICLADIDLDRVASIRQQIPMGANRRL